jgi:hypothetical protein
MRIKGLIAAIATAILPPLALAQDRAAAVGLGGARVYRTGTRSRRRDECRPLQECRVDPRANSSAQPVCAEGNISPLSVSIIWLSAIVSYRRSAAPTRC